VSGAGEILDAARAVVLAGGFAYAARADLRSREVSDALWQLLGAVAVVLGALAVAPGGALPLLLWVVVGAFALEHLLPWDEALGERHAAKVPAIELAVYAGVIALVSGAAYRWGIGSSTVPLEVIAAVATVVLARVLFEAGVLYGGADAKALIVAGILVPIFAAPLVFAPATTSAVLALLPFSVTLLTNAALFSVVIPLAIAVRNVARGEFSFPRGFTGYTLSVEELPRRFVWVRDSTLGEDTLVHDAETSADDTRRRTEIAAQLRDRGVTRVWVTPQLPFLVLMAAGAFAGLLAGNLLLDLFAAL
jgi:preflagellin peptidase FlaK